MVSGPVIKRLFAESGNLCAFPKCQTRLIHEDSGVVVGEMCHIQGKEPGGPRHNPNQSPAERDGYENLILLCSVHHKVVDDDFEAYSVERLATMKKTHRDRGLPSGNVGEQLIAKLQTNVAARAEGGSVITTINQSGGQVAHTINNLAPPKRTVNATVRNEMLKVLAQVGPAQIGFASTHGNLEAHEFKQQVMDVFRAAGWQVTDMHTFMFLGGEDRFRGHNS